MDAPCETHLSRFGLELPWGCSELTRYHYHQCRSNSREKPGIMPLTYILPPELENKLPQSQEDKSKEPTADDTNCPNVAIGRGSAVTLQPLFWTPNSRASPSRGKTTMIPISVPIPM